VDSKKKTILKKELWIRLDNLASERKLQWTLIKVSNDNFGMKKVKKLAHSAISKTNPSKSKRNNWFSLIGTF
jgi:ribonuclease HI